MAGTGRRYDFKVSFRTNKQGRTGKRVEAVPEPYEKGCQLQQTGPRETEGKGQAAVSSSPQSFQGLVRL